MRHHFHFFKPITRFSFYFPFFSFSPRLIILLFLKKLVETNIQDSIEYYVRVKEKAFHDPSPPFKKKEKGVKVDLKLGGQWNVPSLVANGRRRRSFFCLEANGRRSFLCLEANGRRSRSFLAWWAMECSIAWRPMEGEREVSLLGGQWNVKEKNISHIFPQ